MGVRRRNFGGAGDRAKLEYLKTRLILSSTSHRRPEEKSGLNQFLQLVGTIIKKKPHSHHISRHVTFKIKFFYKISRPIFEIVRWSCQIIFLWNRTFGTR